MKVSNSLSCIQLGSTQMNTAKIHNSNKNRANTEANLNMRNRLIHVNIHTMLNKHDHSIFMNQKKISI